MSPPEDALAQVESQRSSPYKVDQPGGHCPTCSGDLRRLAAPGCPTFWLCGCGYVAHQVERVLECITRGMKPDPAVHRLVVIGPNGAVRTAYLDVSKGAAIERYIRQVSSERDIIDWPNARANIAQITEEFSFTDEFRVRDARKP